MSRFTDFAVNPFTLNIVRYRTAQAVPGLHVVRYSVSYVVLFKDPEISSYQSINQPIKFFWRGLSSKQPPRGPRGEGYWLRESVAISGLGLHSRFPLSFVICCQRLSICIAHRDDNAPLMRFPSLICGARPLRLPPTTCKHTGCTRLPAHLYGQHLTAVILLNPSHNGLLLI